MQKHTTTKALDEVFYTYSTGFYKKICDYGNEKCFINVDISCVKTTDMWISGLVVDYHWDDDDGDVYFVDSFYAHNSYPEIGDLVDQLLCYVEKHSLGKVSLKVGGLYFDLARGKDESNIGFWHMEEDVVEAIKDFLLKEVSRLESLHRG